MRLIGDFETRSPAPIAKTGAWKYSEHPQTEAFCLATKAGDDPASIWVNEKFLRMLPEDHGLPLLSEKELFYQLKHMSYFVGHNVFFERSIWENVMIPNHFWPIMLPRQWRCSAAKAAAHSLPRSLEGAGAALGLPIQKDKEGHRVMLKLCKPRKPRKVEREANPDWENTLYWYEDPKDLLTNFRYCVTDVEAEAMVWDRLRDLSPTEQEVWFLDQKINHRGIQVDIDAATAALELIEKHQNTLESELRKITSKTVQTGKQRDKILDFLRTRGVDLPNLQADTVEAEMSNGHPAQAQRVLEIRHSLGKSSTSKYQAFLDRASADGRVRDTLMYHGAGTGRWAGRGLQPHNFVRGNLKLHQVEQCLSFVRQRDFDSVYMMYGDPIHALSSCLRGNICAAPGHDLLCADYSSIEGRGLAWLANEQYVLDNYRAGKCAYCVFASQIHPAPYEEIFQGKNNGITEYIDMRFEGKTGELACGYQGGEKAVQQFAPNMDRKRRKEIVKIWRDNRPMTKTLWYDMERVAKHAILSGTVVEHNGVSFAVVDDFLCCKLPSGRVIAYYQPIIKLMPMRIDKDCDCEGENPACPQCKGTGIYTIVTEKDTITYMGMNSYTRKWERQKTYGGKLVENITQALCRDVMAEAMLRAEPIGYKIVLTVHDEIVVEVPEDFGSLAEFESIMSQPPEWAMDLPVSAEGWRGKIYRKG
jgi:DNA polymerase